MNELDRLQDLFTRNVLDARTRELPWWKAWLVRALRISYAVAKDLAEGQLTLRAMSLVYTTLLSLVPLLAVSFSVLKAFGVHNQIEPLLEQMMAPLGAKGGEVTQRIIQFVENIKVGVLGAVGLALLLYTVIALMQKVELAFNYTWRVRQHRTLAQRFSYYLSVLLVGPVLVFAALGVTASVLNASFMHTLAAIEPFGRLMDLAATLVPYLLIIGAFTFLYVFIPNTRVRIRSALAGAVVGGIVWESTGWAFASFIVTSARYTAIYSAFAALIMFMIWLYLSWLILLVGASVAYYHQHPRRTLGLWREQSPSGRIREELALLVMYLIGRHHYLRQPPWSAETLAERLNVAPEALDSVLKALSDGGMIVLTQGIGGHYIPAAPLDSLTLKEVLDAVRRQGETRYLNPDRLAGTPAVKDVLLELDRQTERMLEGRTVKDLVFLPDASLPPSAEARDTIHINPGGG